MSNERKTFSGFAAVHRPELTCPACGEPAVHVAHLDVVYDSDELEAFCSACGQQLSVWATVEISYSNPEAV